LVLGSLLSTFVIAGKCPAQLSTSTPTPLANVLTTTTSAFAPIATSDSNANTKNSQENDYSCTAAKDYFKSNACPTFTACIAIVCSPGNPNPKPFNVSNVQDCFIRAYDTKLINNVISEDSRCNAAKAHFQSTHSTDLKTCIARDCLLYPNPNGAIAVNRCYSCTAAKAYFNATGSSTLIKCIDNACYPGQTQDYTVIAVKGCYDLEYQARRNNYGAIPKGW
jgi:hypothetical protein